MYEAWKAWGLRAQAALQHKLSFQDTVELVESAETLQDGKHAYYKALDVFRLSKPETFLWNSVIQMYIRCGSLEDARLVFNEMDVRDVFSWNLMLTAYAKNGHSNDANRLFTEMPEWNIVSFNSFLSTKMMENPASVNLFFDSMPAHDLFSWNGLLAAYARQGHNEKVSQVFENMPERDLVSWNIFMGSFTRKSLERMKRIFDSLPETNLVAWNELLAAYARSGHLLKVEQVFAHMPCWDMVSFGTLLSCYLKDGRVEDAKVLFDSMEFHDVILLNAILLVYSSSLEDAMLVFHAMQERDRVSWTTMLSIFINNGAFDAADRFFNRIPEKDVVSMTSILTMFAQAGRSESCFEMFSLMQAEGLRPDETCFTCLLLACMHSGNSKLGWKYFQSQLMDFENAKKPSKQQYACMVDILGRAGYFEEAKDLLVNMPYIADGYEWTSVLSSCRSGSDDQRDSFSLPEWLLEGNSSPYVLLSNIHAETNSLNNF